jgi:hypothetical protein
MSYQFAINIDIILLYSSSECRDIDGNVDDAEEGQSEHCRDRACQSGSVDLTEFCVTLAIISV